MTEHHIAPGLLPVGLRDTLPPSAESEARLLRLILDTLAAHGYERVATPLVEFEEVLVGPIQTGARRDLFRFIDPASQHMLALRADITGQIARLASTRLAHYARPLRLSYMGPVVRIAGTPINADRQFLQVGGELIGDDGSGAAAETLGVALECLAACGLSGLSVDIAMPSLLPTLASTLGLDEDARAGLFEALDAKDAGAVRLLPHGALFAALLDVAGPADEGLARLRALDLPAAATRALKAAADLRSALPAGAAFVSIDPTEQRGFAYHTHVGFTIFAPGVREEVVRGGAYRVRAGSGGSEPAVGFSLYLDRLVEAQPTGELRPRLFLPLGTPGEVGVRLRGEGWATVAGLAAGDAEAQARAQRCSHIWRDGAQHPLQG